jgi:hypothetical protein
MFLIVISFTFLWEGSVGAKPLWVILHWIIIAPQKINQMSAYGNGSSANHRVVIYCNTVSLK